MRHEFLNVFKNSKKTDDSEPVGETRLSHDKQGRGIEIGSLTLNLDPQGQVSLVVQRQIAGDADNQSE
jgi:hypothetical protein